MPPKPKFTKDEIVQAALEVVSQKGVEALTAKELGDALGSSARPIFTVFRSMKEVQDEVRAAAMRRFERFAAQTLPDMPLFNIGMVFQHFELFPHLSILDNLTLAQMKVLGRSRVEASKRGLRG